MKGWPGQPVIYEVNTAVWLRECSIAAGRPVMLGDVPDQEWDAITPAGADAVWLMGVWHRSHAGLAIAQSDQGLRDSIRRALPDVSDDDVVGSPYCVQRYVPDPAFGGIDGLVRARQALAARGFRLVLDYVPNHVAPDHPWVVEHPARFVRGDDRDLEAEPGGWVRVGDQIVAHGRDPYFPPWPDVVQLDAFSPELRAATIETLGGIAGLCDGIRCDMAMLMFNDVFAKTWAGRTGPAPPDDFWPTVITAVRAEHPETVLIAEAYWDLEWELQQQGFDYCYDKRLYDRLVSCDAGGVRGHLSADLGYQRKLLRFLENHDEPRVADVMPPGAERAAAVALATLPGGTMWHEGQFEGRRIRLPVFLSRRPDEPLDRELGDWYRRLISAVERSGMRSGDWKLLDVDGWADNQTAQNLLAWIWTSDAPDSRPHLVVVNLSDAPAQGRIPLPPSFTDCPWRLSGLIDDAEFDRDGDELVDPGMFVGLGPWEYHVLGMDRPGPFE